MGQKWVLVEVIIVAAVLMHGCHGCWDQERVALLNLKHTLHHLYPVTRTWMEAIDNNASANVSREDCCKWEGVECSITTGRVVSLSLGGSLRHYDYDYDYYYDYDYDYYYYDYYEVSVKASLFLPFQELRFLNLSHCHIHDWIDSKGPDGVSTKLSNLEFLDLSYNYLNNSVLPYLSGFSSLKLLNLNWNWFMNSVQFRELPNVEKLESLNLDGMPLEDEFLENIGMMTSLKQLSLGSCGLQGDLLSTKGFKSASTRLNRLEVLHLGGNNISGITSLSGFTSLKSLDLAFNNLLVIKASDLPNVEKLESLILDGIPLGDKFLENIGMMTSLKQLSLRDCGLQGNLPSIKDLSNFEKLESLRLDGIPLGDEFLENIGMMISLKQLSLRFCGLQGKLPSIKGLEFLDLSFNDFNDSVSLSEFESLKFLDLAYNWQLGMKASDLPVKKLENLYLEGSTLEGRFLENIGGMTSLEVLYLDECELQGTFGESICKLERLQMLSISGNNVSGTLPRCFTNLTSLRHLDLSFNQFTGEIFLFEHLTSIEVLALSDNYFQIPISLNLFFNHSKLFHLDALNNEILVQTEVKPSCLAPKFQLNFLRLSSGHGAAFPDFLYCQHDLEVVDISNVKMRDGFPSWLLANNRMLYSLSLVNNSLSGTLHLPNDPHLRLTHLDISVNYFSGQIPQEIGTIFPHLSYLNMSGNGFNGSIPSSLGDMDGLYDLDLSTNQLSGGIPEQLVTGCSSLDTLVLSNNSLQDMIASPKLNLTNLNLRVIDASNNQLFGKIPTWIANLTYLQVLDLSHNNIYGSLPIGFSPPTLIQVHLSQNRIQGPLVDAFSNCSSLITLDLSHNQLNSEISDWILGLHNSLQHLLLNDNQLQGGISIPFCFFKDLRLIDLSHNNLSSCVFDFSCLNAHHHGENPALAPKSNSSSALAPAAQKETLPFTTKSNSYMYHGKILAYMSGINLAYNRLTGEIPPEIGNIGSLHSLNLSHNDLTGSIPSTLSNLIDLESLDLSYNNLNGTIPSELVNLTALGYFTVAHNNLSGQIPDRFQFATFSKESYEENPFLCGPPLPKSCMAMGSPSPSTALATDHDLDGSDFIDIGDFYVTFLASYACVLLGFFAVLVINPRWRRVWFYFIELSAMTCYYYIMDNLCKLSWSKNM